MLQSSDKQSNNLKIIKKEITIISSNDSISETITFGLKSNTTVSKAFLNLLQVCLYTLGLSFASSQISLAQVTSDNTLNTEVNQNGNVAEITGGETREGNLFHSFQDFSVPTNNEAFFNNANDISNIFSRVTGGNISNIDGLIRANGSANLFLINPAGILFGENASLSIGGSFYGSSASSIVFENGEFSTDLDTPPLLTVNAPIGLGFRDNPGDIATNQSSLTASTGQTLALLGGNLNFDGGSLGTLGGRVELGGLTESGIVSINEDGSFNFPEAVARGNVSFTNGAQVFVAGDGGGSININANNLSLTSVSRFFAGIAPDLGSPDAQAGDVVIDLTNDLVIDNSAITNSNAGVGNAGNVIVNARNISFSNGGNIGNFNNGAGNIGDLILTASGDISFDGIVGNSFSGISNFFTEEAVGRNGKINLTAQNLNITNGANISSLVEANNDSGDINLNIADTVRIDGFGLVTRTDGRQSKIDSSISTTSIGGQSGNININAQNLFLSRNGSIRALTSGAGEAGNVNINTKLITIGEQGDTDLAPSSINANAGDFFVNNPDLVTTGGDIKIDTESLRISDGGSIQAAIQSRGSGGNVTINATDEVSVSGRGISDVQGQEMEILSSIFVDISETGIGEAGNIKINTSSLLVEQGIISADVLGEGNGGNIEINASSLVVDQGFITADVAGEGNGGTINIFATDSIELSNVGFIQAIVFEGSTGNGGDLTIDTKQLILNDGSGISARTLGNGNAGTVTINASELINLSGSGIFNNALIESGKGGDINLTTDQLTITDGAIITASNFSSLAEENGGSAPGTGEPGNISITANSLSLESGGRIEAATQAETGTGAEINLQVADSIFLKGDSFISAEALGNANGGNLTIDTKFIVAFEGNNDIIASAEQGQGGNIDITAESLFGIKASTLNPSTNDINASSDFGLDGSVSIDVPDVTSLQGVSELSTNIVVPEETPAQACRANREIAAKNGLTIKGKGGVPPAPELPMESLNAYVNGQSNNSTSAIPQPVETSIGKIQPARGIKVTKKGGIILTAYRTNNQGDRLLTIETSCRLTKNES